MVVIFCVLLMIASMLYGYIIKSKIDFLLSTRHRAFLKSLNIAGAERLSGWERLGKGSEAQFSMEIDGKIENYRKIYTSVDIISRLDDDELMALVIKYRKIRFFPAITMFLCVFSLMLYINSL